MLGTSIKEKSEKHGLNMSKKKKAMMPDCWIRHSLLVPACPAPVAVGTGFGTDSPTDKPEDMQASRTQFEKRVG